MLKKENYMAAILESKMATPEVQTRYFNGFLDLENVGLDTEIRFLSALVLKL